MACRGLLRHLTSKLRGQIQPRKARRASTVSRARRARTASASRSAPMPCWMANPSWWRRHAISKGGEGRSIELRQRVTDREPRRFRLHEDVPLGSKARIVIEYSGVQLNPRVFQLWIGYRRAASAAKGCAIRRRLVAEGGFVPPNQVLALEKAEILAQCTQPRHEGRTAGLAASVAMAQLKGSDRPSNLESDAAAETAASNHDGPPTCRGVCNRDAPVFAI